MKVLYRLFVVVLALIVIVGGLPPVEAQLSDGPMTPNLQPFRLGNTQEARDLRNQKPNDKKTLEDIFRKVDQKGIEPPPIDLSQSRVPGLSDRAMTQLAMGYFVTTQSSQYKKMSDIYAENRAEGKPNFITVDSIMHPYFAFANGMLASAIEESVIKDLQHLLRAMLTSSIADYRRTDDDEVRDDIQRNLAYLCVALRLLEPTTKLPDIGGASQLVVADLGLLEGGKFGKSRIFGVEEDFATFKAWGFMASRPRLRRFFTAYQWLSRMPFPLSNSSDNNIEGGGNTFRRAVLLYRSIVLADTGKEPPLEKWNRIALMMAMTGFDSNARKKTIIPPELAPVLRSSETDFARLLHSLSQPFLRTKLMLSVRNQRPVELNARSVFEMDTVSGGGNDDVVFRFFPLVEPPEMVWLREEGHNYVEATEGPPSVPISLIELHAHGAQQATNILNAEIEALDKGLPRRVSRLERLVRVLTAEDAGSDRHWGVVSNLWRRYPDTVQIVLRSETWMTKQMETSLAAWIDSYSACLMIPTVESGTAAPHAASSNANAAPGATGSANSASLAATGGAGRAGSGAPSAGTGTSSNQNVAVGTTAAAEKSLSGSGKGSSLSANTSNASTGSSSARANSNASKTNRPPRFHYLEPRLEIYKVLQQDAANLVNQLTELKYMPPRYVQRQQDFLKLLKRLVAISELEIKNEPISMADFNLLANIDRVLEPVDCPCSAYIYLDANQKSTVESSSKTAKPVSDKPPAPTSIRDPEVVLPQQFGATIGTGRAGKLYIICSTSQGPMLTRGGCYTLYEIKSGALRDEHWERKMTYGLLQPPFWTKKFNFGQESKDSTESKNTSVTKEKLQNAIRDKFQSQPSPFE